MQLILVIPIAISIGLFIQSLFDPSLGAWNFVVVESLFATAIFLTDEIKKPTSNPLLLSKDDWRIIQRYHLYIRYPMKCRIISFSLQTFRWFTFLWIQDLVNYVVKQVETPTSSASGLGQ